ncbi:OmpA family protein [Parabacteroides sp. AM08-6]|uniref:OmpA family protein n=1 Tax=Parabacteroides sp. AM08-6 TaxID=2292053 RepID=UPI000EFEB862|nr:OmpA family protein [Parabacteroides sp. AM08-6]RHJ81934.1 OmpA family protein [Parabacteroides sp. AM08-6]
MKTKVLLLALLSGFVFSVAAQEFQPQVGFSTEKGYKTNFKKNKARDNWFISIAGGGSILLGDQNSKASLGDRINFAPQFSFGKWFNPYLAFRMQLNGGVLHGFEGENAEFMQHNKYAAAHVDLLWDVTNFWAPYNEKKVFRLIPWVGFGYAQRFKTSDDNRAIPRTESPTLNAGLLMAFRVSKRVDINVEAQGSLLNEQFNRVEMNHLTDGIAQLSAGLTFKLGKTDFEVLQPMDYDLLNDLNNQINSLRAANDELSKRPESCPECEEVVTNVVNNYVDNVVYFRLNSAKIDKNQQISIYNTAQFIKDNGTPIKVVGYADKKTGTSTYNMGLSEKRARAVAKELIEKYGISSSQITIEWRGSDVQPYSENNWNRVVIMTAND